MSEKPDYYELLDVPRDADAATIKKAFRKKAMETHPDRNPAPEAEEAFKRVNEAYATLSDPDNRAHYDRYGHGGPSRDPFSGGGMNPEDLRDVFGGDVFEQLFGSFFRHATRSGAAHGRDIVLDVELTLEEVAHGGERTVQFRRPGPCRSCDGTGAEVGSAPQACERCGGAGRVRVQRGYIAMVQTCPSCRGEGKTISTPCKSCRGSGLAEEQVSLTAPLPAGLADGHKLRLEGEGARGRRGGLAGDLYLRISVTPHPFFERDGSDLICEVPLGFPQVALGAQIEVPTLEGKVQMKVPAGTQSGQVLRLKGKGLPRVEGRGRGDQMVRLQVETPVELTARQRELLEEFERICAERAEREGGALHTEPKRRSFLDKLKSLFE